MRMTHQATGTTGLPNARGRTAPVPTHVPSVIGPIETADWHTGGEPFRIVPECRRP